MVLLVAAVLWAEFHTKARKKKSTLNAWEASRMLEFDFHIDKKGPTDLTFGGILAHLFVLSTSQRLSRSVPYGFIV